MAKIIAVTEPKHEIVRVVRVAVNTNFRCTVKEWEQLDKMAAKHSDSEFFVNCNIRTPNLATINDHPYKAVITANPELVVKDWQVQRLALVNPEKVAFVRVKYIPEFKGHLPLITHISESGYPVVVTPQRFNGLKGLNEYSTREFYKWSHNRFRLNKEAMRYLKDFTESLNQVYICDESGAGCKGCMLCSTLPTGKELGVYSVDLSSSGLCPYSCPDCYAKTMQRMLVAFEMQPVRFDKIKMNIKQAGRSAHAKEARKNALIQS